MAKQQEVNLLSIRQKIIGSTPNNNNIFDAEVHQNI